MGGLSWITAAPSAEKSCVERKLEMAAADLDAMEELDENSNDLNLFEACKNGDLERVASLLIPDSVNSRDIAGRKSTPLHFAAGIKLASF